MELINIYRDKKIKEIEHEKDEAIIAIKTADPVYAELRKAKKSIKNADDVVSLRGYTFPKEVNEKIAAVRADMDAKLVALDSFISEVYTMVELADKNKDKLSVLKTYGIID